MVTFFTIPTKPDFTKNREIDAMFYQQINSCRYGVRPFETLARRSLPQLHQKSFDMYIFVSV